MTPSLNIAYPSFPCSFCIRGIGVLPKVRLDIQTLCLQNEYRQSLYHPADPPLIYFDSLICTSPSSVVQMIWSLSAILISVFIVPVTSFPHTTTIRHLRKRIWDILPYPCISSASPSSRNGENPNLGQIGT